MADPGDLTSQEEEGGTANLFDTRPVNRGPFFNYAQHYDLLEYAADLHE